MTKKPKETGNDGSRMYVCMYINQRAAETRGSGETCLRQKKKNTAPKNKASLVPYRTGGVRLSATAVMFHVPFVPTNKAHLQESLRNDGHRADGAPHPGRQKGQQQQPILPDERARPAIAPAVCSIQRRTQEKKKTCHVPVIHSTHLWHNKGEENTLFTLAVLRLCGDLPGNDRWPNRYRQATKNKSTRIYAVV